MPTQHGSLQSCVELATAGGVAGGSTVHTYAGGGWSGVVAKVLRLEEEDKYIPDDRGLPLKPVRRTCV